MVPGGCREGEGKLPEGAGRRPGGGQELWEACREVPGGCRKLPEGAGKRPGECRKAAGARGDEAPEGPGREAMRFPALRAESR